MSLKGKKQEMKRTKLQQRDALSMGKGRVYFSTRKRHRKLVCSDCRHVQQVSSAELKHAARMRCELCGGPLNDRAHVCP